MPERFEIYRYFIVSTAGPAEARWSFVPLNGGGYAGHDEPSVAQPMGNQPADTTQTQSAGHVEAPEGSRIASFEPPVLEILGRGQVDVLAVIGVTAGHAEELGALIRWHPLR